LVIIVGGKLQQASRREGMVEPNGLGVVMEFLCEFAFLTAA
jgi:hypothetical protein